VALDAITTTTPARAVAAGSPATTEPSSWRRQLR
jgi:hypothetical protein